MHAKPQNTKHDVREVIQDLRIHHYLAHFLGESSLVAHYTDQMYAFHQDLKMISEL